MPILGVSSLMTGRALGRGPFLFALGNKKSKEQQEFNPMSRLFERFETAADTFAIATLLVGLPCAVGAIILASF